jgi:hypothetical protein
VTSPAKGVPAVQLAVVFLAPTRPFRLVCELIHKRQIEADS